MPHRESSFVSVRADGVVVGCLVTVLILATISIGCQGVVPIPENKHSFVGKWRSDAGITIEIFQNGTADLQRGPGTTKEADSLDINASDTKGFRVYFNGDSAMELMQPFNISRTYRIDKSPSTEGERTTMTLNSVVLVKE